MTASVDMLTRERVERADNIIAQYRAIGKPIESGLAEELRSGDVRSFMKVLELETNLITKEDHTWQSITTGQRAYWPGENIIRQNRDYKKSQEAQIPSSIAA